MTLVCCLLVKFMQVKCSKTGTLIDLHSFDWLICIVLRDSNDFARHFAGSQAIPQKAPGKTPKPYFFDMSLLCHLLSGGGVMDMDGTEVDLLDMADAMKPSMFEIKSSRTYRNSFMRHLDSVGDLLCVDRQNRGAIMRGESTTSVNASTIWAVDDWAREAR